MGQNNPYNIADDLFNYVKVFYSTSGKNALSIADSLYVKSTKECNTKGQCMALTLYSDYYYYNNDLDNLLKSNKKIYDYSIKTKNYDFIFLSWTQVISYYLNLGESSKAYMELLQFQKEAVKLKSKEGIGMTYRNLGNFYLTQNNPKLAIEQYKLGANYYMSNKIYQKVLLLYCSIAFAALDFDSEILGEYSQKALKLTPKYGGRFVPTLYCFASAVENKDIKQSETLLNEINTLCNNKMLQGSNREVYYQYIIKHYLNTKQYKLAEKYVDSLKQKVDIYKSRSIIAESEGNYKKSYQYLKKKEEIKNSTINTFGQNIHAEMVAYFDKATLEAENDQLKTKSIKIRITFCFLILFIIIIFLSFYNIVRRRTIKKLKEEQEVANEARKAAEKADNLKTVFLQNMSHEIRTPLNAIIGFSDILCDNENNYSSQEKEEIQQIIHSNSNRLLTLINDILDLSKLESGNYILKSENISVNVLCHDIISSMQSNVPKDVSLIYESNEEYKDLIIYADGLRIGQIITNFLTNACKYTSKGSITLTYNVYPQKQEDNIIIEFSVSDTGPGIPKDKANIIFQRFEKLGSPKAGTGIGLNICQRLAILMKGNVYYDTEYKDGARFVLRIPARRIR